MTVTAQPTSDLPAAGAAAVCAPSGDLTAADAAVADAEVADPRIEALVHDLIGRVADKWTMLLLEVLGEHGTLRFTRLSALVLAVSQKMLTQTLRQMERDGLVTRTVHPVVPPRVEYALTPLGLSLGEAFCGVWIWVARHVDAVGQARRAFDQRLATVAGLSTRAA